MKLHIEEFNEGMKDILELHKQGNNIFEMKGGSLFPHHTGQKTWEYAKNDDGLHLSDGTHTYSFKGELSDMDTQLEKMPDVPWPDLFKGAKQKGKAQVHRSDPGSIYFTLQEGRDNPTYTLRHEGDHKWKAIPKARKVKAMLKQPLTVNVNVDSVKEGMLKELDEFIKEADASFFDSANHALGKGVQWLANAPANIGMFPARMTGPVTQYGDNNQNATEPIADTAASALIAGGLGAGAGGLYHLAKRHILNTPEENQMEDESGGQLMKRMAVPGAAMAGLSVLGRRAFPSAVNNPELEPFPSK